MNKINTHEISSVALKSLMEAGWSVDRNSSRDDEFIEAMSRCVEYGFLITPDILQVAQNLFGLRLKFGIRLLTFEEFTYNDDTLPEIESWMAINVKLFPIGDHNGDPILMGHDGRLYLTNFDVVLRGDGSFYKALSDLIENTFLMGDNSVVVPPSI
jgi:SUKH-3 immunity protein